MALRANRLKAVLKEGSRTLPARGGDDLEFQSFACADQFDVVFLSGAHLAERGRVVINVADVASCET